MTAPQRHRPAARIRANGQDITTKLIDPQAEKSILASLCITDEAGIKSDRLEMVIDARPGPKGVLFAVPPIGSEIEVALGYEPAPVAMGKFRLDTWEKAGPPTTLTLIASAVELTAEFKAKRLRSWHDTTVGEIVNKIAAKHGLGVALDTTLAARPIEHLDQQAESDMGFLTRLAGRNDATFKVANGQVIFTARASLTRPAGDSKDVLVVRPTDVSTWSVRHGERAGHKSAVCYWQDHDGGKRIAAVVGKGTPRFVDQRLYGSKAEAEAAARAALNRAIRGRGDGEFTGPGNPLIYAEAPIRLEGFDPDCDGLFFAQSVTHRLDAGGYTTSVTLESELGGDSD